MTCSISRMVRPVSRLSSRQDRRPCGRSRSGAGPPSPRRAAAASDRSRARAPLRAACGRASVSDEASWSRLSNRSSRRSTSCARCARAPTRSGRCSSAPTITLSSTVSAGKRPHDLEGAADAAAADLVRRQPVDALARERDVARVGREHAGDHVEQRGLAGAVRADHGEDLALRHVEARRRRPRRRPRKLLVDAGDRQERASWLVAAPSAELARASHGQMPSGSTITTTSRQTP